MCYICNFFGWTLDLIQRVITFVLACWMAIVICVGLAVGIVTGIAYGYNYSIAEFLTFKNSDVQVLLTRGKHQPPDVVLGRKEFHRLINNPLRTLSILGNKETNEDKSELGYSTSSPPYTWQEKPNFHTERKETFDHTYFIDMKTTDAPVSTVSSTYDYNEFVSTVWSTVEIFSNDMTRTPQIEFSNDDLMTSSQEQPERTPNKMEGLFIRKVFPIRNETRKSMENQNNNYVFKNYGDQNMFEVDYEQRPKKVNSLSKEQYVIWSRPATGTVPFFNLKRRTQTSQERTTPNSKLTLPKKHYTPLRTVFKEPEDALASEIIMPLYNLKRITY